MFNDFNDGEEKSFIYKFQGDFTNLFTHIILKERDWEIRDYSQQPFHLAKC